jgi:predicted dehydrogenase
MRFTKLNSPVIVLVEKPALPTSIEARELGDLAARKNLVLYAYQNRRWDADFLALRRLLSEPPESKFSLGDVVDFESQLVTRACCAYSALLTANS